ncbi:MAG: TCP-1/cpn60 chaperonin family protein [Haloarculaceae archaeon]
MTDGALTALTDDASAVCGIVRSTLGPFGATKLVVDGHGNVTATDSGTIVLEGIDVENPAVTTLSRAASGFERRYGDGSTTLVTLVGGLLEAADRLVGMGFHPTAIERGYREGLSAALDSLDRRARPLEAVGPEAVVRSALTGTRDPQVRTQLGSYLAEAIEEIAAEAGEFDPDMVKVIARLGGSEGETELVHGVVMDRDPVAEAMPRTLRDVGIAVVSETVDVPKPGGPTDDRSITFRFSPESFEDRAAIGEREREDFEEQLEAAIDAGLRVILTERGINERVERILANHGVLAIHQVEEADVVRLARAIGATVVPGLAQANEGTLGHGTARVVRRAGRDMTVVEAEGDAPVYTLFCRAPDERAVEAFERSVEHALAAVTSARRTGTVASGGGAVETAASGDVREHARSVSGRERLAVEAFGDALTAVPRTLARNAGLDGGRSLVRLRVAHHEGRDATGVDCLSGELVDTVEEGIVDPVGLKREAWSAATDLACYLLRIDEQVAAKDLEREDRDAQEAREERKPSELQ